MYQQPGKPCVGQDSPTATERSGMRRRQFLHATLGTALAALSRYAVAQPGPKLSAIDAVLLDGGHTTLKGAAVQELRDALHGRLLLPQDDGYEEARHVHDGDIDKHPALIVQMTGAADVATAIDFARENQLLVAVKCSGHQEYGLSTCDGGMMIDLSLMRDVRVDARARRAWVTGGSLSGLVDHEAVSQGLVAPMGDTSTTGIGDLATGGGFGRISRHFGLTLDSVRSVDIVTANGKFVHASATDKPDLFWAVRGGGGNFGVVTNFELELHPMQSRVVSGSVVFPFAQARQVLSAYADYSAAASDELYVNCLIRIGASTDESTLRLDACYSGDPRSAEKILQPIPRFAQALSNSFRTMSYLEAQGSDQHNARSAPHTAQASRESYYQAGLLRGLDPELIAAIVGGAKPIPGGRFVMLFQHAGGAMGRVANTATAFSHRYVTHDMIFASSWNTDDAAAQHRSDVRQFWQRLKPHTRGFYGNEMAGGVPPESVPLNYGENYSRLVKVKNAYDPGNLFRLNANVQPRPA
jgi:FAD/FMN-containing dehydrogenase